MNTREKLIIILLMLLGGYFRLIHLVHVGFKSPFLFGGLFLEFSQQIIEHQYSFPKFIPFFTDGGIPFAYPPLPFYIEAVLIEIFPHHKYLFVNLLPPLISTLSLPVFYQLSRELDLNFNVKAISLAAYATMTAAYKGQVEGGGLSEALGSLSILCMAIMLVRTYKREQIINYGLTGITWAICVVASPGSAYASLPTFLIFSVLQIRKCKNRRLLTMSFLIGTGVIALVVSCPYWLTVIRNHGANIFIASFIAQHSGIVKL